MTKGKEKGNKGMTERKPLPRAQEWKRMDTISVANSGRRLLKDILENNLDEKTTLKKIGLAVEAFSQITILWLDNQNEKEAGNE